MPGGPKTSSGFSRPRRSNVLSIPGSPSQWSAWWCVRKTRRGPAGRRCAAAGAASPRRSRTAGGRRRAARAGPAARGARRAPMRPCRRRTARARPSAGERIAAAPGGTLRGRRAPARDAARARSSVDRAPASGAGGQRFESSRARPLCARRGSGQSGREPSVVGVHRYVGPIAKNCRFASGRQVGHGVGARRRHQRTTAPGGRPRPSLVWRQRRSRRRCVGQTLLLGLASS